MSRRNRTQWGVASLPGIPQPHAHEYRAAGARLHADAELLCSEEY